LHPGFGVWRGETHCVGWNAGTNPLPLVLASDVATAIRLAIERNLPSPRSYNLVGDVHLSARDCVRELRSTLKRPLVFHPGHPAQHWGLALAKSSANALLDRPRPRPPTYRMFRSKGCWSQFDCADVKRDLGWHPVVEREQFMDQGLRRMGDAYARLAS
jgi:nucleoside-diphosphate-sugar epimerase